MGLLTNLRSYLGNHLGDDEMTSSITSTSTANIHTCVARIAVSSVGGTREREGEQIASQRAAKVSSQISIRGIIQRCVQNKN